MTKELDPIRIKCFMKYSNHSSNSNPPTAGFLRDQPYPKLGKNPQLKKIPRMLKDRILVPTKKILNSEFLGSCN